MVPLAASAARESPLAPSTAFLIVLGLAVAAAALSGLRHVAPSERLVVRRFGRTRGVRGPGLRYLLPLADSGVRVPVGPRPHDLWFRAMTRDGVPVRLKAHALMGADDPVRYAAAADISGTPSSAAQAATEVALRGLIADRDLADLPSLLAGGDDPELVRRVDEAVRPWGVAATLVSITDATVPVRSATGSAATGGAARLPG
ncbi:SPFH domain-containing protein [Actinomadura sp. NAK00032]|uniref:SPFH domain-containing protein n=1 Tax=Actinomadura sp. NAK00032 TaxID=2742128 RepID=UPI0015913E0F|nr:SPFH domain-containing protein [Actinomadura sp. NAK00032]QKW39119.1 SPFH domain-containing protein [Actinomadura sp. NAK00032]